MAQHLLTMSVKDQAPCKCNFARLLIDVMDCHKDHTPEFMSEPVHVSVETVRSPASPTLESKLINGYQRQSTVTKVSSARRQVVVTSKSAICYCSLFTLSSSHYIFLTFFFASLYIAVCFYTTWI